MDATQIGDELLLMAREPNLKSNLGWMWVKSELRENYRLLREHIESRGFTVTSVVLDGRRGIPAVFKDIPVQTCQFHQFKYLREKLTMYPKLPSERELLHIAGNLSRSTLEETKELLNHWFLKYGGFVTERTHIEGSKKKAFLYPKIKTCFRSLERNLPSLYMYQTYPHLNIPNTTNSLDGYWSRLKNLLSAHRGTNRERIKKMITEILRKQTA